jgi:hypothetical protein
MYSICYKESVLTGEIAPLGHTEVVTPLKLLQQAGSDHFGTPVGITSLREAMQPVIQSVLQLVHHHMRTMMKRSSEGKRIKVRPNHWARPNATGTILNELLNGRYEILFDKVGTGYDGGSIMILGESDFKLLEDTHESKEDC